MPTGRVNFLTLDLGGGYVSAIVLGLFAASLRLVEKMNLEHHINFSTDFHLKEQPPCLLPAVDVASKPSASKTIMI